MNADDDDIGKSGSVPMEYTTNTYLWGSKDRNCNTFDNILKSEENLKTHFNRRGKKPLKDEYVKLCTQNFKDPIIKYDHPCIWSITTNCWTETSKCFLVPSL